MGFKDTLKNVSTGGLANAGGMFTGGSDAPNAPDFNSAVERQAAGAHPNQTNAFGAGSQWTQGPNGQWTQSQNFGGPIGDASQNLQQQILAGSKTPLDNGAQARQHAEDAIYSRETARLDPMFAQREGSLRTQLLNQGLDPGSQGARTEMDTFNRGRNDAYSSALQDAISGGGAEAQRQQGMDINSRMAPMQELQGFNAFNQQGAPGQGTQYLPAALAQYQGDLQKYGIQQQGKNSTMNGATNLAAMAAMAG